MCDWKHPKTDEPCWIGDRRYQNPQDRRFCIFHAESKNAGTFRHEFDNYLAERSQGNDLRAEGFIFPPGEPTSRMDVDGADVKFDYCVFPGKSLRFNGNAKSISFTGARFDNTVDINQASPTTDTAVKFCDVVFHGSLVLRFSCQSLSLVNVEFRDSVRIEGYISVAELDTVAFNGRQPVKLTVQQTEEGGRLRLNPEVVGGDVELNGSFVGSQIEVSGRYGRFVAGITGQHDTSINAQGSSFSELHLSQGGPSASLNLREAMIAGTTTVQGDWTMIDLSGTTFADRTTIKGKVGTLRADSNTTFEGPFTLKGAETNHCSCVGATFQGIADFENVEFSEMANFDGARFEAAANFRAMTKSVKTGVMKFTSCSFKELDFQGRQFSTSTDFRGSTFAAAPRFFDCKIHRDTHFPRPRNFVVLGGAQEAAKYRMLRHEMENNRSRQQEGWFFELEQESIRKDPETDWIERIVSCVYRTSSRYGQSIWRPVIWMFVLLVVCATSRFITLDGVTFALYPTRPIAMTELRVATEFAFQQLFAPFYIWRIPVGLGWKLAGSLASVFHAGLVAVLLVALRWKFRRG